MVICHASVCRMNEPRQHFAGWGDFGVPTSGSSLGTGELPSSVPFDHLAWWPSPSEQAHRPAGGRCRWRSWSPFSRMEGQTAGRENGGFRRAEKACNSCKCTSGWVEGSIMLKKKNGRIWRLGMVVCYIRSKIQSVTAVALHHQINPLARKPAALSRSREFPRKPAASEERHLKNCNDDLEPRSRLNSTSCGILE
jgi:hypothetical protein